MEGSNDDNIKRSFKLFRCTKLEFISVWKGRPKETTVQAKLSVQVCKSNCVSVNDKWIQFDGKYRSEVACWRNDFLLVALKIWVGSLNGHFFFFDRPLGLSLVCPNYQKRVMMWRQYFFSPFNLPVLILVTWNVFQCWTLTKQKKRDFYFLIIFCSGCKECQL